MQKLVARVWLMYFDYGIELTDAVKWVTRRMPAGIREYCESRIIFELERSII